MFGLAIYYGGAIHRLGDLTKRILRRCDTATFTAALGYANALHPSGWANVRGKLEHQLFLYHGCIDIHCALIGYVDLRGTCRRYREQSVL